jgi:hypothetical protein
MFSVFKNFDNAANRIFPTAMTVLSRRLSHPHNRMANKIADDAALAASHLLSAICNSSRPRNSPFVSEWVMIIRDHGAF